MTMIQVVDVKGQTIGAMEKISAHLDGGIWHRAISVFLFDSSGRLLIQQRAQEKYHFGGLWANSCCSHPTSDETPVQAATRTMAFELGVSAQVSEVGVVRYEAFDAISGQTEREHDHVLIGRFDGNVRPNPDEVLAVRWISTEDLRAEIDQKPEIYAPWLPVILDEIPMFDL
jgi:isopentenyl-diphosphate delta-isomerase